MNTRKQKANENYRRKFYELGLNSSFEFVGFEKKNRIWFRCKKCGRVSPRGNDVFRGKQQKLICKECGNGSILNSPFVDGVLAYYADGHTVTETCEKFFISKSKLNNWVKIRHVSNGRTFEQGGRESNKARAEATVFPGTHNKSYYARAKLHGAPAEVGITLNKLIKRDGLTCKICGLPCLYYGDYLADLYPTMDHIIPISKGGGHTWENVQVAHRICNSNKSDHIGKEWNNAD